jgi:hypothetical protein
MNLLRSTLYSAFLLGTVVSVALFAAPSVEAGSSFSSSLLPARFLSELPPSTLGFALQEPAPAHYTRDQWDSIIDAMVAKGLNAPDEDLDTIAGYLATYFGPAKTAPPPTTPDAPAAPPPQ